MKQAITKQQWDELSDAETQSMQMFILDEFIVPRRNVEEGGLLNIGQMIEFLGDDLDEIVTTNNGYLVDVGVRLSSRELADALWGAVKQKLGE